MHWAGKTELGQYLVMHGNIMMLMMTFFKWKEPPMRLLELGAIKLDERSVVTLPEESASISAHLHLRHGGQ